MHFPTITLEGNILSTELLDRLEADVFGQEPKDFRLERRQRVKDEIARIWSEATLQWKIFQSKKERLGDDETGTSITRRHWIEPLLENLGYRLIPSRQAEVVNGRTYFISHRDEDIGGFPVHIEGFNVSLDKRREQGGPRLSPHALVQEYLNVTEHLYGVVTNGHRLRLLRNSLRLTRLSYVEFDLVRMMEEEAYADFAILYRLLHRSRMPGKPAEAAESIIERYHQDVLESGEAIRDKLSNAVEQGVRLVANGLLRHPANGELRDAFLNGGLDGARFYTELLRLVYRLLFLLVIEERDLVYPRREEKNGDKGRDDERSRYRDIYYRFYSIQRLRRLAEQRHRIEGKKHDLWIGLMHTFRIFERRDIAGRLGLSPLAGELFGAGALDYLSATMLDNATLLEALDLLARFRDERGNWVRVRYSALNVEEFGSVYEGMLEFDPHVETGASADDASGWHFSFREGRQRATTGSHYTPDDLVRPLIANALDPVIQRKLAELGDGTREKQAEAILSIKVCDPACGSGHFLLAAARRLGTVLASLRTGEDQPSPKALREAIRDVINRCIYGVDVNPMAVELCKVALWLEAHNPGMPLTFLDHRIQCGDAIVGLADVDDLKRGIPEAAFKSLDGDDKAVAATLRKRNKAERNQRAKGGLQLELGEEPADYLKGLAERYSAFERMPDRTLAERAEKQRAYHALLRDENGVRLKQLADLQLAPFFIRKNLETRDKVSTDGTYRRLLNTRGTLYDRVIHPATGISAEKRFFHWFLAFPEVSAQDGFDCVLGNPPFLGNRKINSMLGADYLNYLTSEYAPAGAIDVVGYFFRRVFSILRERGSMGMLATNTIAQGNTREGGLAVILEEGGTINFAIRSMKWPGRAAVEVGLITVQTGPWKGKRVLDGHEVEFINSYLSDDEPLGDPYRLMENAGKSFIGSYVLGMGFILEPEEAQALIAKDPRNADVLFPYLNGEDLNSRPDQSPSRWVINFFDWPIEKAQQYPDCFRIIEQKVKQERLGKAKDVASAPWWQFWRSRAELYRTIASLERVLVVALTSKTVAFCFAKPDIVFSHAVGVIASADYRSFALLQSSIHYFWSWMRGSTLKGDLRYTPSSVFETFPFPDSYDITISQYLDETGSGYYTERRRLAMEMGVGLTQFYNLFHQPGLSPETLPRYARHVTEEHIARIERLRELHVEMDIAVRDAYGWDDVDLEHGFHEVEFLPENDRIRFTISREARKEVLRRLLELNHERWRGEKKAASQLRVVRPQILHETQSEAPSTGVRPVVRRERQAGKRSSTPEYREAVLIAALVRAFGTRKYPLGRKRLQKLMYLVHRRAEQDVRQLFAKKAAGPYSSWARYEGPEAIATRNQYVEFVTSPGTGRRGFIPASRVDDIDQYLPGYDFHGAIEWVKERCRFMKTDDLELITTVDYASLELRQQSRAVSPLAIREVIAGEPEWAPKLKRELFSLEQIERALSDVEAFLGSAP